MNNIELEVLSNLKKNYNTSIPDNLLSDGSFEFLIELIKIKPSIYILIPPEKKAQSYELSKIALEKGIWIRHIPKTHDDYNLCVLACTTNSMSFADIPEQFKDQNLFEQLIKAFPTFYYKVPDQFLTPSMALTWASRPHKKRNDYQKYLDQINKQMPDSHKTEEFSNLLLEKQPTYFPILSFLTHLNLSDKFYLQAVKNNPTQIQFVSQQLRTNIKMIKSCLKTEKNYMLSRNYFVGYNTQLPYKEFKNDLIKKEIILKTL